MSVETIIIRYEGPHTLERVDSSDLENSPYFLSGRRRHERTDQIQYFGITTRKYRNRIRYDHQALGQIREDTLGIWLGQLEYPKRVRADHLNLRCSKARGVLAVPQEDERVVVFWCVLRKDDGDASNHEERHHRQEAGREVPVLCVKSRVASHQESQTTQNHEVRPKPRADVRWRMPLRLRSGICSVRTRSQTAVLRCV